MPYYIARIHDSDPLHLGRLNAEQVSIVEMLINAARAGTATIELLTRDPNDRDSTVHYWPARKP